MQRRPSLSDILNIQAGEGRLVALLMVYSAAMTLIINYYFTASSALFLAHYDARVLPYTIVAASLALFAYRAGYRRAEQRLTENQLVTGSLGAVAALLLLIRIALAVTDAPWLTFVVIVLFRLVILMLVVGFWSFAERLFTLGQSKRLFGTISAGGAISVMIGSFLVPVFVRLIGTENLFVIMLLCALVALACVRLIQREYQAVLAPSDVRLSEDAATGAASSWRSLLSNRYVQLIALLYVLAWTSNYILDYTFLAQLQTHFLSSPEQIAAFIGIMFGLIQLATTLIKVFVSGRFLMRFGLRAGLLTLPVVFTVGVALASGVSVVGALALFFWVVIATKWSEETLRESFNEPSTRILYQPLPPAQRAPTLALVEGSGYPITALIAGVVLVLFVITETYTPQRMVLLLTALGVAWVVTAIYAYRRYVIALGHALTTRELGVVSVQLGDPETIHRLVNLIASPRADEVVYAMRMLESYDAVTARQHWPALLTHPSADVRAYALDRLADDRISVPTESLLALANDDPSPDVRGAALRAYGALAGADAVDQVEPFLASDQPEVVRGALDGLLLYGGQPALKVGGQKLNALLSSTGSADRVLGAQVIGDLGAINDYTPLARLLLDADDDVRRAALVAAGKVKNSSMWPLVIGALADSALRPAAINTLTASGGDALPEINRVLWADTTARETRLRLLRACARIGDDTVIAMLRPRINWPDRGVRLAILDALCASGYRERSGSVEAINPALFREASDAAVLLSDILLFETDDRAALLRAALDTELDDVRERMLLILSFLYDRSAIARVRNAMRRSEAQKSYAAEMIDVTVDASLRRYVQPLFSQEPNSLRLRQLEAVAAPVPAARLTNRLWELAENVNGGSWLRATAIDALSKIVPDGDLQRLEALAASPDALVRETAARAVGHQLQREEPDMLSTIEKVIILKTVPLFSTIPDAVLAQLAAIVIEERYTPGQTIIRKGDEGRSMYVIVTGTARAHDEQITFNSLSDRDVFGEMAALDPEPRSASITAETDMVVFRLDRAPFYEVMGDYPDISRAVIITLIERLRARMRDVAELTAKLKEKA